jgi:hypothetical protein
MAEQDKLTTDRYRFNLDHRLSKAKRVRGNGVAGDIWVIPESGEVFTPQYLNKQR